MTESAIIITMVLLLIANLCCVGICIKLTTEIWKIRELTRK